MTVFDEPNDVIVPMMRNRSLLIDEFDINIEQIANDTKRGTLMIKLNLDRMFLLDIDQSNIQIEHRSEHVAFGSSIYLTVSPIQTNNQNHIIIKTIRMSIGEIVSIIVLLIGLTSYLFVVFIAKRNTLIKISSLIIFFSLISLLIIKLWQRF